MHVVRYLARSLSVSLIFAAFGAVLGIALGYIRTGGFVPMYAFDGGIIAGTILLALGLLRFVMPDFSIFGDRLVDWSTFWQLSWAKRENSRIAAFELLYIGFGTIMISGMLQYVYFVT